MGGQVAKHCSACHRGPVADDIIETNSAILTDEQSCGSKLLLPSRRCNSNWERLHDDTIVNLFSPAWCDGCGALLVGVLQQSRRCRVCKRLACEHCATNNPCFARSLLSFVVEGSKEMPAAIRVLCMDMALIHGLASEHPEVLEYSAEELWRNPAFLRGLVKLADGSESASYRKKVAERLFLCKKSEREAAVEVLSAMLQEEPSQQGPVDLPLSFAIELLKPLAEGNPKAFATVKESLKHGSPLVRTAAVKAAAELAQFNGFKCSGALCARIRDTDAGVRSAATSILPTLELEERTKMGAWMACLQDGDATVRKTACKALFQCGGIEVEARSRSVMVNILLDKDQEVRAEAWSALLAFKTTALTGILVSLARSRLDDMTRKRLVQTLRGLLSVGDPKEVQVVASSLTGASWWLRLAMCESFCQQLDASNAEVRAICVSAVDSLADRTDNKAAAAVAAKLQDSDAKVANAAWAAIRKRLGDADPDVNRVWLEEVHCHELNPSVRGEVIGAVLSNLTESSWLIQMAATRALKLKQPAESREVLEILMIFKEDDDPAVQQIAEDVLEHFLLLGRESAEGIDLEPDSICKSLSSTSF